MSSVEHIENPDVILIGSGVMSATLGGVLKNLQPDLKIQLYEVTPELAQESSNGWNNAVGSECRALSTLPLWCAVKPMAAWWGHSRTKQGTPVSIDATAEETSGTKRMP